MRTNPRPIVLAMLLLSSAGQVRDVDGKARNLFAPDGIANVLLFVASDCPISNGYAPEIQRICRDYSTKGVACSLVYEDVSIDASRVRAHRDAYGYKNMPAVIDGDRAIAERAKAAVTPQAVVVGKDGNVKYRGRIDNQYAALGKPRRVVTVHDLRDALDAVLAGRAVAHPETEALGCFISKIEPGESKREPGVVKRHQP
jgi:AhpC/TSA family